MIHRQHRFLTACIVPLLVVGGGADAAPRRRAVAPPSRKPAVRQVPARTRAVRGPELVRLVVQPEQFQLSSRRSRQLLVVTGTYSDGSVRDLSAAAEYRAEARRVARVSPTGLVEPAGDGTTTITVRSGLRSARAQVRVTSMLDLVPKISFTREIVPVLTQAGCNSLSCHGSPVGKAGFKLSMYGFDPAQDYLAIVRQERTVPEKGLRVDSADREKSLVLTKPSMQLPHQGGMRFKKDSPEYRKLLEWLESGLPNDTEDALLTVSRLEVLPGARAFQEADEAQRLVVRAHYSDGTVEDITHKAVYSSNDTGVASVDTEGVVQSAGVGETVVLVRYLGQVTTTPMYLAQRATSGPDPYTSFRPVNFIDELTLAKWKKLRFVPTAPSTDAEFLRRVSLDLTGTLPRPDEIRAFLANPAPDKRARKIDELLERPDYADWWTVFWGDMLRNNSRLLQAPGARSYHGWIRQNVLSDRPYDQFVRELVTATGKTDMQGQTNFYRIARTAPDMAEQTAQLFLGVRLQCANCHNHPFEKWTRTAYHQFAAFFARVQVRNVQQISEVMLRPGGEYRHPETNQALAPAALESQDLTVPEEGDRRTVLADWLATPKNDYFTRNLVNRLWAQLFGIGIVEPVDDVRLTNPASNEPLLEALAREFVNRGLSIKSMLRTIANSRTYQLSAQATPANEKDTRNFSRAYQRRLKAEALLDAISQATDVPEAFNGYPVGTRAIQLIDNRVASYFMDVFGRPRREVVCTCEREEVANLTQALHMLNGNTLQSKLTASRGRVAAWLQAATPDESVVEDLYLWTLSRRPDGEEQERAMKLFRGAGNKRQALEDLFWALLNAREFLYNH